MQRFHGLPQRLARIAGLRRCLSVFSLIFLLIPAAQAGAYESFTFNASLYQGIGISEGMAAFDPRILTLIINPSNEVKEVLPEDSRDLFNFSDEIDFYFAYDPDAPQHITLMPEHLAGLAVLEATSLSDLNASMLAGLEFAEDPPPTLMNPGDLVVLRLNDGSIATLGDVKLQEDWTLTFDYIMTDANAVPEPSVFALLGVALGLWGIITRKRKNRKGGSSMKRHSLLIFVFLLLSLNARATLAAEVSVVKEGTGDGVVFGEGIECGNDCTETYPDDTILHLKVEPRDDSEFLGWLVNEKPQEGTLVIRRNTRVTAIFERKNPTRLLHPCGRFPTPPESEIVSRERKNLLRSPNGDVVAAFFWQEKKRMLALASGAVFEIFPYDYVGILVSDNAEHVVVKYRSDLFFYNSAGELQREIVGVHEGITYMSISGDGYVAIGGRFRDHPISEGGWITLYDPSGQKLWDRPLGPYNWVFAEIGISSSAEHVAVAYVHQEHAEDIEGLYDVKIFRKDGSIALQEKDIKYLNNFLFSEDGRYLILVASRTFSIRDLASGTISWDIPRLYRLAGPHAARILPGRNLLALVTLHSRDVPSSEAFKYHWQVRLLNLNDGEEVFSYDLPGLHPGSEGKVILFDDERTLTVITPDEQFCFQFED